MNKLTRLIPAVTLLVAVGATVALAQGSAAAVLPAPVVLLPTVQVIGSREAFRTEVVQLPTVTVIGQRDRAAATPMTRTAQRGIAPRS